MAPPPPTLKDVKVLQGAFAKMDDPKVLMKYVTDAVAKGSNAGLYKNPFIITAVYDKGTQAAADIQTAMDDYATTPSPENEKTIGDKMVLAKGWLKEYSKLVEPIANDNANRSTREEAATNILAANLSYQKLTSASAGDPITPAFTAKSVGDGKIKIDVINGAEYHPRTTLFLAVQLPDKTTDVTPDPIVTLVKGQLKVSSNGITETITQSMSGKGRTNIIATSNSGSRYAVYLYSQNGKKEVSELSMPVTVKA